MIHETPSDEVRYLRDAIEKIADELSVKLDDELIDRQYIAEHALHRLDTLLGKEPRASRVWAE